MLFRNPWFLVFLVGSILVSATSAWAQEEQPATENIEITQLSFRRPLPKDFPKNAGAFERNTWINSKPAYRWTFLVQTPHLAKLEPAMFGEWLEFTGEPSDETIHLKPRRATGLLSGLIGPRRPDHFVLSSIVYGGRYGVVELEAAGEESSHIAGKELSAEITITVAEGIEVATSEIVDLDKPDQEFRLGGYKIRFLGEVEGGGVFFDPTPIKKTSSPEGSTPKPVTPAVQAPGFNSLWPVPILSGKPSRPGKEVGFEITGDIEQLADFTVLVDGKPLSCRGSSSDGKFGTRQFWSGPDTQGIVELKIYQNLRTVKKTLSVTVPEN